MYPLLGAETAFDTTALCHSTIHNEVAALNPALADAGAGEQDGWHAKEFIEDGATGRFYPLNNPGLWRKVARLFSRVKVGCGVCG